MEPSPEMSSWLMETAASFHGARRRRFMAQAVEALGLSQRRAARALGWSRDTVRKGLHELHSGITCLDNFSPVAASPSRSVCPRSWPTSATSSRTTSRPTRPSRPRASTAGCPPLRSAGS